MTGAPNTSVIVVSRHRPHELVRALTAIRQLDFDSFEVVVVADPTSIKHIKTLDASCGLKLVAFDEPNISKARNLGVRHSGGDIIAFIDDDAAPEPTWLSFLTAPFADDGVGATCGYVRGRNGISFQSRAECVDQQSWTRTVEVPDEQLSSPSWPNGFVHKLIGTNMAIRRSALEELGGFDEAFRFYLDDTDLSLRFAQLDYTSQIVPYAQVHHAFAPSCRRRRDRTPLTLFNIGRSLAIFLRKHSEHASVDQQLAYLRNDQESRLVRHMIRGNCEPRDVQRILRTFDKGVSEGLRTRPDQTADLRKKDRFSLLWTEFSATDNDTIVSGRRWSAGLVKRNAKAVVSRGHRCSAYTFSLTSLFHSVQFSDDGYWIQSGGLFGRSDRTDPIFRFWTHNARLSREIARTQSIRPPSNRHSFRLFSVLDGTVRMFHHNFGTRFAGRMTKQTHEES